MDRRFYSQHPPRAEYALTRRGHELGVVAGALAVWGRKHLSDRGALVHRAVRDADPGRLLLSGV